MSTSDTVTFRRLARDDLAQLTRWLNTPHVYAWWGRERVADSLGGAGEDAASLADVEEEYGPEIDGASSVRYFVIECGGTPIGMIQTYPLSDSPDYAREIGVSAEGTAGVDLLIGDPNSIGHGVGPRVIVTFVREIVFASDDVHRCVAGPEVINARSIRAFEKAGFAALRDAAVTGGAGPERIMVRERDPQR